MIEPSNSRTMIQGSNVHDRKRSSIIGSMGHNALKRKQRGSKEQSEIASRDAPRPWLQRLGAAGTAESRAAGTFAGRNVCMKATRPVTSEGVRFLPKAGILPPP